MAIKITHVANKATVLKSGKTLKARPVVVRAIDDDDDDDDVEFDGAMKFVVRNADGVAMKGEMSEPLGDRKKQHKRLKPIEKQLRKLVRRQKKMLDRYIQLHERSNRKKKNGWARDMGSNVLKLVRD